MKRSTAIITFIISVTACSPPSTLQVLPSDASQQGDAGILDHLDHDIDPDARACGCGTTPVQGTLYDEPLIFPNAIFGATISWGTHGRPQTVNRAIGLILHLKTYAMDCPASAVFVNTAGPTVELKLTTGSQQASEAKLWRTDKGKVLSTIASVCIRQLGVGMYEPVHDPADLQGRTTTGCVSMRFEEVQDDGETVPVGTASGEFTASYCAATNISVGE